MLPVLLFACGLLFVLLGWSKTTLINSETHPKFNEGLSISFFIYGLIQISISLMLFNASAPYGALLSENTTIINNYSAVVENASAYDSLGVFTGSSNNTVNLWVNQTKSFEYAYSTAGSEMATGFFYANFTLLTLYILIFGVVFLGAVITKLYQKRGR